MNRIKKNLLLAIVFVSCTNIFSQATSPYESKIDDLLKRMTLEEKVGQMAQFTGDVLLKTSEKGFVSPVEIDEMKLKHILNDLKAGSILNTPAGIPHSVIEWEKLIKKMQDASLKATGIPMIYGIDAIHGANYTLNSTMFPQQIAMAATFNRNLVFQGAKVSAYEVRASLTPWNFSPVLDMGRNQCWSRIWETYGEDTYLTSELGVSCILGYQGSNKEKVGMNNVAACLKHFVGYGMPTSGQDRTPAVIPEYELRERHLPPHIQAIKAGALSLMVNSAIVNGEPVHSSHHILTEILKNEIKFDGVVVTDWQDINNLFKRDRIAASDKEAIMISINAGVDMAMIPYDENFCKDLIELVKENKVSQERINDAVRRILRMKYRLGLFENPVWKTSDYPDFSSDKSKKMAKESADESITLLKNLNNILPLSKNKKILVTGPNANSKRTLNGGWSFTWQGEKTNEFEKNGYTFLEALKQKVGENNVVYEAGVTYNEKGKYFDENSPEIEKVIEKSKDCEIIVAFLGENSYCETPGNLTTLEISKNQQKLISELSKTGKPLILVLNEGRPRIFSDIEPFAGAILQTYLPGSYGSLSLADILYGDINPSGRLPYTYPKYTNLLTNYDYKPCENRETMDGTYFYEANNSVQYPFGFGLSYTSFEYNNLTVDKPNFSANDTLQISVNVKNTGKIEGKETVLLFVSDDYATLTPDNKRLRGFEKISLKQGESTNVKFKLAAKDLAFYSHDNKKHLEKGSFTVKVGDKKLTINASETNVW